MSGERDQPRIPLQLSMDDPEPMYRQIESQLRDFILGGHLPSGTRLPTVRALATDLACSVITTRRAYQDLEAEGFILTRQGRGTVVAPLPEEKLAAYRRQAADGAMREAVRAALRAGLEEKELRDIFDEVLEDVLQEYSLREQDANIGGTTL